MAFRQEICVTPEDHSSRSGCEGSLPQELPTVDTTYSVKDLKVRRADCLKGRVTLRFVSRPFLWGPMRMSPAEILAYLFFFLSIGVTFVTSLFPGTLLFR